MPQSGNASQPSAQRPQAPAAQQSADGLAPEQRRQLVALFDAGQQTELEAQARQLLASRPASGFLWKVLGACLKAQGKDALAAMRRAAELSPTDPEAHGNLGIALAEAGQFDAAAASCRHAITLRPGDPGAHINLGNALKAWGRLDGAAGCFRQALSLDPGCAEAHQCLGATLNQLGQTEAAVASLRRALQIRPGYAEAHCNLGTALGQAGQGAAALESFRQALRCQPGHSAAETNLGLALLQRGEFEEGWRAYRARSRHALGKAIAPGSTLPALPAGQWDGGPLDGKAILVWREQGLGDEIQFSRYVPELKRRGARRVILACRPPLCGLFATLAGVDEVFPAEADNASLPPHDCWAMLLDLPYHFGTRLDSIPAPIPYLSAEPALLERAAARLGAFQGRKIGLCWRGNPNFAGDARRSIPLAQFQPLFALPGWRFVSLVPDSRDEFAATAGAAACDFDAIPLGTPFADTAALLMQLDLVITCDTAVAHLAGALGRPVWLLLPFVTDWRWLEGRADSPWYPATRLFRQPSPGDWAGPVRQVCGLLAGHGQPSAPVPGAVPVPVPVPASGPDWKALGITLLVQGKDALPALHQAAALLPEDAETHAALGIALKGRGLLDEAAASYRRALALQPGNADVHNNLGNVQRAGGQLAQAAASYRQALLLQPDHGDAHGNLAKAMSDLGQLDGAAASFRAALARQPGDAGLHGGLGNVLLRQGQLQAAEQSFRRALQIQPDWAQAHSDLGVALRDLRQPDAALASFRKAQALQPGLAAAIANEGGLLQDIGQLEAALDCCRRALALQPDNAEMHSNLGNVLSRLGQLDGALASYRRALAIRPDCFEAHSNLLFIQNYQADQPPALLLEQARRFGAEAARRARPYSSWPNSADPERTLRVGLVSGDLRSHPVGFFAEGMLAAMASSAPGRLAFFAYPGHLVGDDLSARIQACCEGWQPTHGLSDQALAARIHADRIDILLDLSGHTGKNRLPMFAWKPAPVQASWLGYFATTGLGAIDWFIADCWMAPPPEAGQGGAAAPVDADFTETIVRLPETFLCFTPPQLDLAPAPPPALAAGHITFGCFNNLTKMNDGVVALWARVLHAVPGSRLLLIAMQLKDAPTRQAVAARFAAQGIEAGRLALEGAVARADYLAAYHRVDIALDPFPFPGGTTSVEGLWMGVPVLTLEGRRYLARQGVGILRNLGLPGWIAADADSYVRLAAAHAADLPALAALRAGLRQCLLASPLCDAPRFARHFEAALRAMWCHWCARQGQG